MLIIDNVSILCSLINRTRSKLNLKSKDIEKKDNIFWAYSQSRQTTIFGNYGREKSKAEEDEEQMKTKIKPNTTGITVRGYP